MIDEVLSKVLPLVTLAEKAGADEVELFALSRKEKIANIESNILKTTVSRYQQGVGIRVLVKKSLGFAAVNSFKKEKILEGIQDAISIAKVTPSQEHYMFPETKKIKPVQDIYDEEVNSISMERIIDITNACLKTIHDADSRLTVYAASLVSRSDIRAIASSAGMDFQEKNSSISWGVFGWAVDGDDIGSACVESDSVVLLKELNLLEGATSFSEKALQCLGANKTDAFKGCAIFSPEAILDLFPIITTASMGSTIQAGNSYLQDKLGEKIAVKELTISDDGSTPNSVSSGSFDREGIPHKPLRIIGSGIFKGTMHNAFTARKAGLDSTGHAMGTYRQAPSTSETNLQIHTGSKTLDEMISEVDHGIYIQRVSVSPNYTSGDFSAVAKGGQLIEKGEITSTLKEITAVGNIFEGVKNISAISKERKYIRTPGDSSFSFVNGSWLIPHIRIENLDFTS